MKCDSGSLSQGALGRPIKPSRYQVSSQIDVTYREDLDQLFFFNPRQSRVKGQILNSAARYGLPEIQSVGLAITLGIKNFPGAQSLFIMGGRGKNRLLGAFIYVREKESLAVLYLALKPSLIDGWQGSCALLVCVTQTLRGIASRVSGVNGIEFRLGEKPAKIRIH